MEVTSLLRGNWMKKCTRCNKEEGKPFYKTFKTGKEDEITYLCENCLRDHMIQDLSKGLNDFPFSIDGLVDMVGNILDPQQNDYESDHKPHEPKQESPQPYGQKTMSRSRRHKKSVLHEYCFDLTELARMGEIDPIVGRDDEIERVIHILNRRTKNNPVLIGEPGVGKTAIVEGLALQIAAGNVPEKLKNKSVLSLDITAVTAGTMYRGMFEERMKKIVREVELRDDVLLFIDEIHMIMGAGSSMDSNIDAANILKPYLARGTMQLIGATSLEEYRKIEEDAALERRLQTVKINEPTVEQTLTILKELQPHYEQFHEIHYSEASIEACARLADRYISERFMPDKAIDLMDEVGSRLNLLKAEETTNLFTKKLRDLLDKEKEAADAGDYPKAIEYRQQYIRLEADSEKQKKKQFLVEASHVEQVVEKMTGIPVSSLKDEERKGLISLQQRLNAHVVGQEQAVESVVKAIKRNRVNIRKTNKPITFLFAGPTGVGKTELTKYIASEVLGDKEAVIRFDMSEYMEEHSVSKLIGSPPGYLGHDEAGQLTEQVRRKPYSVILLDEIEKANKKVLNLFLQLFDEGRLTDSKGTTVDFTNTIIVMTSNLGVEAPKIINLIQATETSHFEGAIRGFFAPEFLNRIDKIVPFNHLTHDHLIAIVDLMLVELVDGLRERQITLSISQSAKDFIVDKGYDRKYGARPLARAITDHLEDALTDLLIEHPDTSTITVDVAEDGQQLRIQ